MAADDALPFLISLMKLNNPMMKEMKNPMTIIEHSSGTSILRINSTWCSPVELNFKY